MAQKGTVKWFNKARSFGFITPDHGGEDVFVHIRAVEHSGLQTLTKDQMVTFDQENRNGRPQAVNLLVTSQPQSNVIGTDLVGTVKWFDDTKGFGFIKPKKGGDDVFVHITAIEASGFERLCGDQAVAFDLITGKSGRPQACNIKVGVEALAAE